MQIRTRYAHPCTVKIVTFYEPNFMRLTYSTGYACYLFFWNSVFSFMVVFSMSLPLFMPLLERREFVVAMLVLNGLIQSCTFVPLYVIMEQIALKSGFSEGIDSLRLNIALWINFMSGMFILFLVSKLY